MLEAAGAPFVQGHAQGSAYAAGIVRSTRELRRRCGLGTWWLTLSEVHLGQGRRMRRHAPQLWERLAGIAAGAGVGVRALELHGAQSRIAGVGSSAAGGLEARLEIPAELEPLLFLRRSCPEAGGFHSVELTCAPWAGCLAGINEGGLGVVVLEDRGLDAPSLRVLAQDLIYRRDELDSAVDHLRRRAAYLGATGVLHLVGPGGRALRAELCRGALQTSQLPQGDVAIAECDVWLEPEQRALVWRPAAGGVREGRA